MAKTWTISAPKLVSPVHEPFIRTAVAGGAIAVGKLVKPSAGKLVVVTVDAGQTVAETETIYGFAMTAAAADGDSFVVKRITINDLFECNGVDLDAATTSIEGEVLAQADFYDVVDGDASDLLFNAAETIWGVDLTAGTAAKVQLIVHALAQGGVVGDTSPRLIVSFRSDGLFANA